MTTKEQELRELFKKEFCSQDPDLPWFLKDIGSPVDGEEIASWWLSLRREEIEKIRGMLNTGPKSTVDFINYELSPEEVIENKLIERILLELEGEK